MLQYTLQRFGQMLLVLLVVSVIVFGIMNLTGDPVLLLVPPEATDEEINLAREQLGLNLPLWEQYGIFLNNAVHGNLGVSFVFRRPAVDLILERMPATLEMTVFAMLLAGVVAIPLGVFAGAYPNTLASRGIMSLSLLGISLPSFWLGIMLILLFAVETTLLPSSGRGEAETIFGLRISIFTWDGIQHIIMPALTLAVGQMAMLIRLTRAGIMEVMRQDYIKFAKAKGVSEQSVLFGHALKNALIPVITVFGLQFGQLIAFATITETIFSWPGMGKLLIDSIYRIDRPVIVAYLLMVAVLFVVINFLVDLIYTLIDPRIEMR
ncbi:ABC transporter permease [Anaerosporomusa subterranea]|uniref:ABC transporter permease n=1 Tax=Anaerosporomusa subterranea TaxID=1794912 RepID=A0A154BS58_ANASB|nr:ABC transporter permease [Anaerosporomusa subterranea]KYZ76749.1 ABC transporter permease [Anaerosporomusa subterranea]